jgi:ACS family hexuronate transporter-like MFS transporter
MAHQNSIAESESCGEAQVAVALINLAAAAHLVSSANLFTLPSDMFPGRAVGSVVGIRGAAGGLGGFVFANTVGHMLRPQLTPARVR